MKRRFALILSVGLLASPLAAQDVGSQISQQLQEQGYKDVSISKTWLGRLRIEANSEEQTREIIVNPRTGEILRDFLSSKNGAAPEGVQILDRPARAPKPEHSGSKRAGPEGEGGKPNGPGPEREGTGGGKGPSR